MTAAHSVSSELLATVPECWTVFSWRGACYPSYSLLKWPQTKLSWAFLQWPNKTEIPVSLSTGPTLDSVLLLPLHNAQLLALSGTGSIANLLWLCIKFMLPSWSHLVFFSFLHSFNTRSVSYNVLLWKVRFNELFNAVASWGMKCCLLIASGSFTLGWASVVWAKEIKTGTLMATTSVHLLQAMHTFTLCFTLARLFLKQSFYYQRPYSTLCWETAPACQLQHRTFKVLFPKFLNFWLLTSYCHMAVVPTAGGGQA